MPPDNRITTISSADNNNSYNVTQIVGGDNYLLFTNDVTKTLFQIQLGGNNFPTSMMLTTDSSTNIYNWSYASATQSEEIAVICPPINPGYLILLFKIKNDPTPYSFQ